MTSEQKQEIVEAVAGIGAHASEFPSPTDREKDLLRSIQFLCMALIKVVESA